MNVTAMKLKKLLVVMLRKAGSDDYEADVVAEHLVSANLCGHDSHGAGILPTYIANLRAGLLKPGTAVTLVDDQGSILLFDGGRGYGQRVAAEAMLVAIDRCREKGVVAMALRNAHHIGRIGAYGEQAAAAGLVSLHFVNVIDHDPNVAPFGTGEARFSTNPVCMAMPATDSTPAVILDISTSTIAFGKARLAMKRGESLPPGVVVDANGQPTADPGVLFREPRGALLPFGGYKGFGLALFCELLAGVLTGGGTIQPRTPRLGGTVNNMLTFLLDPRRLVEHGWMQAEVDALVGYLKDAAPVDPAKPVLVAGDRARHIRERRQQYGIELEDATWEELLQTAAELGLERVELEGYLKAA